MDSGLSTGRASEFSVRPRPLAARCAPDTRLTPWGLLRTLAALLFGPPCSCFSAVFRSRRTAPENSESQHAAHLPAQQSTSSTHPRISCAHGHQIRAPGARSSPREGPQAPDCLSARARPQRLVRSPTCKHPRGRSNRRNASGRNPNSTASIVMRAAPPTPFSRSSRAAPAASRHALDWRLPPASSATQSAAIASSAWSVNRFDTISMNCRPSTSSSTHARARAMRRTLPSSAASKSTGAP